MGKRRESSQAKGGGKGQEKRKTVHKKTEEQSGREESTAVTVWSKREKGGSKGAWRGQRAGRGQATRGLAPCEEGQREITEEEF